MKKTQQAGLTVALALVLSGVATGSAQATSTDWDNDGMPNTWETRFGLDPRKAADATGDPDRDRLTNLREHRLQGLPRDEDSDDDGQDDGDELVTRTGIRDADSDDDGRRDGDEDADRDRIANEDEDDALESCATDDDDRDRDHVDDEDENEQRQRVLDSDSDDDGLADGAEDGDRDGVENEDEDDVLDDSCSPDRDGDGEDDEDETDRYGTLVSFDAATNDLVVRTAAGFVFTFRVTADTELEWEYPDSAGCSGGDIVDPTVDHLQPDRLLAELELEDDRVSVEELELWTPDCPPSA